MRYFHSILFLFVLAAGERAWSQGAPEVSARCALFVFDGGEGGLAPHPYSSADEAGKDRHLKLFTDADVPALFIMAAFDSRTGQLVENAVKSAHAKEASTELSFPNAPAGLSFDAAQAIDLYVAILKPGDSGADNAQKLIAALESEKPGTSTRLRKQQASLLRQILDGWSRKQNDGEFVARHPAPSVAAVRRGDKGLLPVKWREQALRFKLNANIPTVRVFQVRTASSK